MAIKKINLIKLRNIFRNIFDDDEMELSIETTKKDIEDWDSIAQVKLVLAFEEEFGIRLTTEQVSTINSVKDFLQVIEKN